MKTETVTEFVCADGTRFRNSDKAEAYEIELSAVNQIMAKCPVVQLEDGEYFVWPKELLMSIRRDLWARVLEKYGESYPKWSPTVCPMGTVGRVLDDFSGPLESAWSRMMRWDFDLGREYEQTYFV